ncbi:hypothetical protein JCM3765_005744 [Sporobolomyces pararoseus]
MASTSSSSSTTSRATRTSSSSSINSTPTPLPTRTPLQDRSYTQQELYRAYAIPVRGVAGERQVIDDSNNSEVVDSRSFPSTEKGKGRAVEPDDSVHSARGKRRSSSGSLRRRSSNSRRTAGLELGLVGGFEEARRSLEKRLPTAEGYPSCNYVGNGILSCYPESNTTIVQGEYSKFIWNAQFPTFIGAGDVDIYLYNANTEEVATSWMGVQNARGMIGITPDEEWWPQESANEWFNNENRNQSIPYYFVIVDGGSQLTGGETHQSTFTVIQTAPPTSLSSTLAILTASSMSSVSSVSAASASSASSVASQLSQSSLSSSSSSNSASSPRTTNANGELQPTNDSGGGPAIPKWAIAIIVILGFFALLAGAFAIYFCLGRARRRRRQEEAAANAGGGSEGFGGGDNGSREPILGGGNSSVAGSPTGLAPAVLGAGAGGAALGAIAGGGRKEKEEEDEEEKSGGLDRNDAARMAEAFRAALRRPEFPHNGQGTESSGESGGLLSSTGNNLGESKDVEEGTPEGGRELIEEELRSEGMSMRDVEGGGGKKWG